MCYIPRIVIQLCNVNQRNAFIKLMFEFHSSCLLHVSNVVCSSSLGRPRRRWVDNIRMDLQEVGCGCMDWIALAQDRDRWRTLVSAVMNLRVP